MKINKKLTLAFLLLSFISFTVISFTSYLITKKSLTRQVLNQLESLAVIQKNRIETIIAQNLERLALVSSRTQLRLSLESFIRYPKSQYQDKMNRILRDARFSINSFRDISVLTLDGKVVASTDATKIGTKYSDEEYFMRGQTENCADIFYLEKNKNLMMYLSGPLLLGEKLIGVVVIEADAEKIINLCKDYSGLGETGYTFLVKRVSNGETVIITPRRFNPDEQCSILTKDQLYQPLLQAMLNNEGLFTDIIDSRGEHILAVTRYIGKLDLGIAVRIDKTEAFAAVVQLRNFLLFIIFVSLIVFFLISLYITRTITKPIIELTHAVNKISEGDLSITAEINSKDEIGVLAQTFNQMTKNLLDNVTERKRAEEQIKDSLNEKIVLLKEIHDRVKNNLQLISSMLYLQSKYVKDKDDLALFQSSQNRIRSMAIIHERLYRSENLAQIDLQYYVNDLSIYLCRSYDIDQNKIKVKINAEKVFLNIDSAIPCGLIINELISNALKHAFLEGEGEILIEFRSVKKGKIELVVKDNGIGLTDDFELEKSKSFGLQLVNTLVDQLHGEMEIDRTEGTAFRISFPKD